ncbi:MAG TPA: Arm DNA-binding domain-containing protein [Granulicella sp.]|jgi:hypothetical protein|nr:Arm DNA-binding domain-containing protein [Granulicella sp.]
MSADELWPKCGGSARLKGKTEKVSLGPYPIVSLKQARLERDELAGMVFRGESPARQKQLEKFALANSTRVQEFAGRYFTEVIQKRWKNPIQLRRYLHNEIYPAFWSRPLREVSGRPRTD